MADSFWTGGPAEHARALKNELKLQLDELRKQRNAAGTAEHAEIDARISELEAEYKSKLDSIRNLLF